MFVSVRLLIVAACIISGVALVSMPARAWDVSDCNAKFGRTNVTAVETFSVDGSGADFGGLPHFAGSPQGTAVICWLFNGSVGLLGDLYADNLCLPLRPCDPLTAIAKIRFQRTNGRLTGVTTRRVLSQGNLALGRVSVRSPAGNFNAVHLELFTSRVTALGPTGEILAARRDFHR